ncbi:hypothetical protein [Spirillospora sp. NPDC047279]|uniref:hypothetical protein n=1 Tax=Spirillospora sp. NPDC047279 TaxID=3155478 RepID=UPI0033FB5BB0
MLTRDHLMEAIFDLIDHPLDDRTRTLSWTELGVDSVTATELLIHLEDVLHEVDARGIEAALSLSATPDELAARLAGLGGTR